MTDLLERAIRDNKEVFEEEPLNGHFDRFDAKLDKMHKKQKTMGWKTYLQIVASVLLVALIVNQVQSYLGNEQEPLSLSQISPEYSEVEFYFIASIENNILAWNKLVSEGFISGEEQEMMNTEMEEFDQMYKELQAELQANPDDKRVVNAMLRYYHTKLSVTTLIIEELEKVKQQKLIKHETEI